MPDRSEAAQQAKVNVGRQQNPCGKASPPPTGMSKKTSPMDGCVQVTACQKDTVVALLGSNAEERNKNKNNTTLKPPFPSKLPQNKL